MKDAGFMGRLNGRPAPHCKIGRMIDVQLAVHNWQQQDLAFILGCSVSYVSAIITGRKRIAADTAKALGIALMLDPFEIMRAQNEEILRATPLDEERTKTIQRRVAERTERP